VKTSFTELKLDRSHALKVLVDELQPDVYMLAVTAPRPEGDILNSITEFATGFEDTATRFELLTTDKRANALYHDDIPLPLAKRLSWSAW